MKSYKDAYQRFLSAAPGRLHFAAHSHHFWPDCTREAQLRYWDDSARLADLKWPYILGEVLPRSRAHLAAELRLRSPSTLVFAPNTHEFVTRLFSAFETGPMRVLTTDSEFHSFARQARRLEESGEIEVTRVAVEPRATFAERFEKAAHALQPDLIFLSQVFFNSGWVVPQIGGLVSKLSGLKSEIVIDGYHSFAAIDVDLSAIQDRAFFLAGGYKYAQAGEGACFMHVPAGCRLRPRNTGWFADFEGLEAGARGPTGYSEDAQRFAGATFDASAWYRFNAVMDWWRGEGVTGAVAHAHAERLQRIFVQGLPLEGPVSRTTLLIDPADEPIGNFLSFRTESASKMRDQLLREGVVTDYRGSILRFGFGLYHDALDVEELLKRLGRAMTDAPG